MADRKWYAEMVEIMQKLQEYPVSKREKYAARIKDDRSFDAKEKHLLTLLIVHPSLGEEVFRDGLKAA